MLSIADQPFQRNKSLVVGLCNDLNIRMVQRSDLAATRALAAGGKPLFGHALAKHSLRQPQSERPLADSSRPDEQERACQAAAGQRPAETIGDFGMAADRERMKAGG